jgi:hypothetical protein
MGRQGAHDRAAGQKWGTDHDRYLDSSAACRAGPGLIAVGAERAEKRRREIEQVGKSILARFFDVVLDEGVGVERAIEAEWRPFPPQFLSSL